MHLRGPVVVFVGALAMAGSGAAQSQDDSVATLVRLTQGHLLEVSLLLAELEWAPRADALVQRAPGSESLGASWNPESPHFQQARQAVLRRVSRVADFYRKSGPLEARLRENFGKSLSVAEATSVVAALTGPAGPAILREEMRLLFSVEGFDLDGTKAEVASPAYRKRIADLNRMFIERMPAPALPEDDQSREAAVKAWYDSPFRLPFSRAVQLAEAVARNALETQITLLMYDDLEALRKELATAVAAAKKGH